MPMNRVAALEKSDDIKNQLIEKHKPEKIILFGSSAWGKEDINAFILTFPFSH